MCSCACVPTMPVWSASPLAREGEGETVCVGIGTKYALARSEVPFQSRRVTPCVPIVLLFKSLATSRVQHSNKHSHFSLPIPSDIPLKSTKVKAMLQSHALYGTYPLLFLRGGRGIPSVPPTNEKMSKGGSTISKLTYAMFTFLIAPRYSQSTNK